MGRNEARNWGINLVDKIYSLERSHVCGKSLLPSSDSHRYSHKHTRTVALMQLKRCKGFTRQIDEVLVAASALRDACVARQTEKDAPTGADNAQYAVLF